MVLGGKTSGKALKNMIMKKVVQQCFKQTKHVPAQVFCTLLTLCLECSFPRSSQH